MPPAYKLVYSAAGALIGHLALLNGKLAAWRYVIAPPYAAACALSLGIYLHPAAAVAAIAGGIKSPPISNSGPVIPTV